jgi:hypothetical protein
MDQKIAVRIRYAGTHSALVAKPELRVNGQLFDYVYNTDIELPEAAVLAAENCDTLIVERLASDAPDGGADLGGDLGSPTFDAKAVLAGGMDVVAPRIAALATQDELAAVAALGDKRKGVIAALDERAKALAEMTADAVAAQSDAETAQDAGGSE